MPSELQRVTLDTNCIIELEEERSEAQQVETLIGLQEQGAIHLRIVAFSASERRPDGTYANNFQDFTSKLRNVGLQDAELLKPIGYWGVSYWNQAIYSTPQALQLEEQIHNILFPNIEYRYTDYCLAHGVDNPSKDLDIYPRWRTRSATSSVCGRTSIMAGTCSPLATGISIRPPRRQPLRPSVRAES